MEHKEFIRNLIRDKLRQNPQNEAITNQLMVILEGLSNISLIYKDNKLLYDEIIKNSFNWVSEILL